MFVCRVLQAWVILRYNFIEWVLYAFAPASIMWSLNCILELLDIVTILFWLHYWYLNVAVHQPCPSSLMLILLLGWVCWWYISSLFTWVICVSEFPHIFVLKWNFPFWRLSPCCLFLYPLCWLWAPCCWHSSVQLLYWFHLLVHILFQVTCHFYRKLLKSLPGFSSSSAVVELWSFGGVALLWFFISLMMLTQPVYHWVRISSGMFPSTVFRKA